MSSSLNEQQLHSVLIKLEREHKNHKKQLQESAPSATIKIKYTLSVDEGQLPGKLSP